MCTFGVLGLSCEIPTALRVCSPPPKFHENTQRDTKRTNMGAGEGKTKSEIFGHPSGSILWGPHFSWVWALALQAPSSVRGHFPRPHHDTHQIQQWIGQNWIGPNWMTKIGLGHIGRAKTTMAKNGLAKIGLAQIGQIRMAKLVGVFLLGVFVGWCFCRFLSGGFFFLTRTALMKTQSKETDSRGP